MPVAARMKPVDNKLCRIVLSDVALSTYISSWFSMKAPLEPQRYCQQINCPHIPSPLVISPACFLLIKLAGLLSPAAGWQTERQTESQAGGQ